MLDDATRYKLLSLLEQRPGLSQRELAKAAGVSLGKVNFCINALVELGWVKIRNFQNSERKRAYLYKLTPQGLAEKGRVTLHFLERKMREHEEIAREISQLKREVARGRDAR